VVGEEEGGEAHTGVARTTAIQFKVQRIKRLNGGEGWLGMMKGEA